MIADWQDPKSLASRHLDAQIALEDAFRHSVAGYWTGDPTKLHLTTILRQLERAASAYGYTLVLDTETPESVIPEPANGND